MTADCLRDRIAQALDEDHIAAGLTLGHVEQAEHRRIADLVMRELADADPADLGFEQVWIVRENDHIIRWDRGCRISRVIERPVYARPHTEETPDA